MPLYWQVFAYTRMKKYLSYALLTAFPHMLCMHIPVHQLIHLFYDSIKKIQFLIPASMTREPLSAFVLSCQPLQTNVIANDAPHFIACVPVDCICRCTLECPVRQHCVGSASCIRAAPVTYI